MPQQDLRNLEDSKRVSEGERDQRGGELGSEACGARRALALIDFWREVCRATLLERLEEELTRGKERRGEERRGKTREKEEKRGKKKKKEGKRGDARPKRRHTPACADHGREAHRV